MTVDITGLDKAEVLYWLWHYSKSQGISVYDLPITGRVSMFDCKIAVEQSPNLYFDYFKGKVIKCDISGDSFDPRLYDRDNGAGKAEIAIQNLIFSKNQKRKGWFY